MPEDTGAILNLPTWATLAIARSRPPLRPALSALLEFDVQLARVVLTAKEPMLAQIRLAWWREELSKQDDAGSTSQIDPLLIALRAAFPAGRSELLQFVDGWESLLERRPCSEVAVQSFVGGHAEVFRSLGAIAGCVGAADDAAFHGAAWAHAKLAQLGESAGNDGGDRALPRLPSDLRALAIIGGLSRRSLLRGGQPLMGDRLSPLAALRLGIFGT